MKHEIPMVKTARIGVTGIQRRQAGAFTLIELLVSITFLVILMLVVTQVIGIVQRTWVRANSRVSQFREARRAFDLISQNLSQATLNTYWTNDLQKLSSDDLGQAIQSPKSYKRQSELHFICGPTSMILDGTGGANYPGHAVFFQAPLGVVRNDTNKSGLVNTANLTNLLCGRGYFIEWGSDVNYRPSFLGKSPFTETVPVRNRLRLMEWSPTAEMNAIYSKSFRDDPTTIRQWYQDSKSGALAAEVKAGKDSDSKISDRFFTRPVAENILALIISPQTENNNTASGVVSASVYDIAPDYLYDSALVGNVSSKTSPQGTQHLLPPLIKVTMVALDERSGETLSSSTNDALRSKVLTGLNGMFTSASNYTSDLEGTPDSAGKIRTLLLAAKLNYRVFTTTIALRQARWSF